MKKMEGTRAAEAEPSENANKERKWPDDQKSASMNLILRKSTPEVSFVRQRFTRRRRLSHA